MTWPYGIVWQMQQWYIPDDWDTDFEDFDFEANISDDLGDYEEEENDNEDNLGNYEEEENDNDNDDINIWI